MYQEQGLAGRHSDLRDSETDLGLISLLSGWVPFDTGSPGLSASVSPSASMTAIIVK